MEDQGKRLLIAVAVAFAIMLGWSYLFPPKKADEKAAPPVTDATGAQAGTAAGPTPTDAAATSGTAPADGAAATDGATPTDSASPAAPEAPRGEEQIYSLEFPNFRADFTTYGGALKSWALLGAQFHAGDGTTPEDLVRSPDEALRPFLVDFPGANLPSAVEWQITRKDETGVEFSHQFGPMKVVKTFTVYPDDFLVQLTVDVSSSEETSRSMVVSIGSVQDPSQVKHGKMTRVTREWKAACYVDSKLATWSSKDLSGPAKEKAGDVRWFGFVHPYFMAVAAVEPRQERTVCQAHGIGGQVGPMVVEVAYPSVNLSPGANYRRTVTGYFGPKYLDKLRAVAGVVGWDSTGFEKSIDLGWFGFIAGPLLSLLKWFHSFVGSWGIAIILLTITVKLATFYWTHKSMKSMKAMSRLKPELEKIKDKYKDDKQRQQVETMNLFRAHGVNPLAGCLPMVLQMPVWFALYRSLSVAAELYQEHFLWLKDLTAPDPFYIMPVLMTVMMLVQSRLTPQTATGMQQKLLTYGMPAMFGVMSLFFPAGLTLYIATNSILTLFHHLYLKGEDVRHAARAAAAPAADAAVIDVESSESDSDGDSRSSTPARKSGGKGKGKGGKGKKGRR